MFRVTVDAVQRRTFHFCCRQSLEQQSLQGLNSMSSANCFERKPAPPQHNLPDFTMCSSQVDSIIAPMLRHLHLIQCPVSPVLPRKASLPNGLRLHCSLSTPCIPTCRTKAHLLIATASALASASVRGTPQQTAPALLLLPR